MFSLSLSWAQSCTVCVDMNGYTGSEPITSGVNIQSNIINTWSIQTPENVLTDPDGDGIYCTTVSAPVGTLTVGYNPALADPCSCTDPQNVTNPDGSVTHFHDILSVTNGGAGAVVTLVDNGGVFLGTGLSPIANNTMLGTTDAAGNLNVDFFHTSGATGTIMVDVGGTVLPFTVDACDGSTCVTIPTMSEWGLMIFGLLILNLGVVFVYRQEEYVLSV